MKSGEGTMSIVFCPKRYWERHKCLPEFNFAPHMPLPGDGFRGALTTSCVSWFSEKSEEEIKSYLNGEGFIESLDLKKFMSDCYEGI